MGFSPSFRPPGLAAAQPQMNPGLAQVANTPPGPDPQAFQQQLISTLDTKIRALAQGISDLSSSYPMAAADFNAALVALSSGRQKVIQVASQGSQAGPASPQMQAG